MRIGVRESTAGSGSGFSDDDFRYLRQIGVDDVNIALETLPGYEANGYFEPDALISVRDRIESFGLHVELAMFPVQQIWDAYFGRPDGERQIENLCKVIRGMGEAGIPILSLRPNSASYLPGSPPGYYIDTNSGRGGYGRSAFDLDRAERSMDAPIGNVAEEQIWEGYFSVYRAVIPVAEEAGVKITNHGNDPPLREFRGIPHVFHNFAAFDRLFQEFPSAAIGMTFCVGTRYESGEDVIEGIRRFGRAERIFFVHLRNVIGTIPDNRGYRETFLDDGDMDMGKIIKELYKVGYEGVVNIDHVPHVVGDIRHKDAKRAIAWLVGYTRALLDTCKH